MKGLPFVLLFTAMTFVAWGAYGPTLHHGAIALQHDSMRAFVGVGLAYFLIAVIIPFLILKRSGEVGRWTITGTIYSLVAGAVGAIGALGILLALGYGGLPVYVMPLVFGFAPVVNTLVTAFLSRTFNQISPVFIAGVVAAALGAVGVLMFKPSPGKPNLGKPSPAAVHAQTPVHVVRFEMTQPVAQTANEAAEQVEVAANIADEKVADEKPPAPKKSNIQATEDIEVVQSDRESTPGELAAVGAPAKDAETADEKPPAPKKSNTHATETDEAVKSERASDPVDAVPVGASTEDGKVADEQPAASQKPNTQVKETGETPKVDRASKAADAATIETPAKKKVNFWGVLGSIVVAAFCWGSYGPMLHIGQGKMSGSRLRPFACVGIAYFVIAVAVPLALIYSGTNDGGGFTAISRGWTWTGIGWSFVAGVAGAVGALGVILAFNAGGKPYYVMPLIFGFAPVINTFISVGEAGTWDLIPLMFWVSLAVVIGGAVTVLINAPKPKPH